MSQFCLQLHATEAEILQWATAWARSGLFVVAERFPPFRTSLLTSVRMEDVADPSVSRLSFFATVPTFVGRAGASLDQLAFYRANPVRMTLSIGRLTSRGLAESSLGSIDPIARWRACEKEVKKQTKAGAVVVALDSNSLIWDRNHRYTVGAEALYLRGITILSGSPNAVFRLEARPSVLAPPG